MEDELTFMINILNFYKLKQDKKRGKLLIGRKKSKSSYKLVNEKQQTNRKMCQE